MTLSLQTDERLLLPMMKTLEQLEDDDWGEPDFDSHLVTECHRLRRIPIAEFSTENLRIMIGQNIGLKFLLPKAMEVLRENPLAAGDFFDGDFLLVVVRCEALQNNHAIVSKTELAKICSCALAELPGRARAEVQENYGSLSPVEIGLDEADMEAEIQALVQRQLSDTPWKEFSDFVESASKQQ